jgi:hypothetical protein
MFLASLLLILFSSHFVQAAGVFFDADALQKLDSGEYKELIVSTEDRLKKSADPKLYLLLAVAHLRDQQEEKSFQAFFKALEAAQSNKESFPSQRELDLFQQLWPIYIANDPTQLECKVKETLGQNPKAIYLEFLLASSSANQHKFEDFFYSFYSAYTLYPKSYLAYKTQGVLSTLLLKRAASPQEKELWRKKAIVFFTQAFYEMPQDFGLHKMLILTSTAAERPQIMRQVVDVIIEKNIQIERADFPFYMGQLMAAKDAASAQRLLDKAKSWYQYSRMLDEMQKSITSLTQEKK